MKPNTKVKTYHEHDSKGPRDRSMKPENSRDLDKKCWSLRGKELCLNRGEDDVKGPHA
jgi:hypothetical protein